MPNGHPTEYETVGVEGLEDCTYLPPEYAGVDVEVEDKCLIEFKSSDLERHAEPE